MRKAIALLLCLVMVATFMPVTAFAADNEAAIGDTQYATLQAAVDAAEIGQTVTLLKNISTTKPIVVGVDPADGTEKIANITIDGNGNTITTTATRVIRVDNSADLTVKNIKLISTNEGPDVRGISVWSLRDTDKLTIEGVEITVGYYALNIPNGGPQVMIKDSRLEGHMSAINILGNNAQIKVENSTLIGSNTHTGSSDSFAVITFSYKDSDAPKDNTVNVTNSSIEGTATKESVYQWGVLFNKGSKGNVVTFKDMKSVSTKSEMEYHDEGTSENSVILDGGDFTGMGAFAENTEVLKITAGTFKANPKEYLEEGVKIYQKKDTTTFIAAKTAPVNTPGYGWETEANKEGVYLEKKAPIPPAPVGGAPAPVADPLADGKKAATDELNAYVDPAKYDEAQATEVKKILDEAKKAIDAAKTVEEVNKIKDEAKASLDKIPTSEELKTIDAVKKAKFTLKSQKAMLKGKKAIKLTWEKPEGLEFEGFEVYRSTERFSGFKKVFTTTNKKYINSKGVKAGVKYFYKVRAYKTVNGEKVYTEWSTKARRIA